MWKTLQIYQKVIFLCNRFCYNLYSIKVFQKFTLAVVAYTNNTESASVGIDRQITNHMLVSN